jgi:hypothetical protein
MVCSSQLTVFSDQYVIHNVPTDHHIWVASTPALYLGGPSCMLYWTEVIYLQIRWEYEWTEQNKETVISYIKVPYQHSVRRVEETMKAISIVRAPAEIQTGYLLNSGAYFIQLA